jgi:Tol biopolymer transport system component
MRLDSRTGQLIEKPKRLTNGVGFCMDHTSVTRDGKRLAFHASEGNATVYVADLEQGGTHIRSSRHLTLDENPALINDWTPDSKTIILLSSRNGHGGIYKQLLNRDTPELLMAGDESVRYARVSPDNKWVIYPKPASPSEAEALMRVPIAGGSPELIFPTRSESVSFCARPPSHLCAIAEPTEDRKQVIVTAFDPVQGRGSELTRFDLDPKEDRWLSDISPDGTRIAAARGPQGPIQILSLRGQRAQVLQVEGLNNLLSLNWAADGKGLFASNGTKGGTVLLHVNLQGNTKVLWMNNTGVDNPGRPSPDGRHLAIQAWTTNSNMWMMENF